MSKDRFLFFENFKKIADNLPDDLRLKFYDALTAYVFDDEEPEDPVIKSLIIAIKPSLDKEEKRGGNHNPTGQNQHSKDKQNNIEVKVGQKNNNLGQKEVKVGQSGQSFLETETGNKKQETKKKNKQKEKISFSDVFDWESLFDYWESWKKGGRYKNAESRKRMLARLKELTGNDFELAKKAICHCVDSGYQGFANGGELFYKPSKDPPKAKSFFDTPEGKEWLRKAEEEERNEKNGNTAF